jgi:hypothetical protein
MTINYTTLLGLAKPVTGTEANTWGDVVNDSITSLLDTAIAGTTTITADTTLTTTTGAANQSRQAILLCSPASANITITAPAQSKIYTVINTSATYTVTVRGVGPTTGVTLGVSEKAVVAWNGSDFIKISNTAGAGAFTTLSVSGVATFSAGTAAAPAITTTGDTNTGIFFPAADTIAFSEGGAEAARIDSSGNFCLGTNSVLTSGKFSLQADLSAVNAMTLRDSGTTYGVSSYYTLYQNSAGSTVGGIGHTAVTSLGINATTDLQFFTAATEQMRLTSTGLLVGTTSNPQNSKLMVGGSVQVKPATNNSLEIFGPNSGTGIRLFARNDAGTLNRLELQGGQVIFPLTSGADGLYFDASSGNLGLGVTPPTSTDAGNITIKGGSTLNFSTASGNMAANATFNSGWKYIATAAAVKYTQSGAEHQWFNAPSGTAGDPITFTQAMTLDGSGNLGIGTTSPSDKLTVISAGTQVGSTNFRNISRIGLATNDASVLLGYNVGDGSGILSSTNNFPLAFWTSNAGTYAERMRIDSSGNLGLGVTSVLGRAQFNVSDTSTTILNSTVLYLSNTGAATTNQRIDLGFRWQDGTYNGNSAISAIRESGTARLTALAFCPSNSSGDPVEKMRIDSSGNVGIGTSSPTGKLNVVTDNTHNGGATFDSTGTTQVWMRDTDATANTRNWGFQISGGDFNILRANDDRATGFVTPVSFAQAPANSLIIDVSGNVGMGTASPNRTGFTAPVLSITNGTSGIIELIGTQTADGTIGQVAFYNTSSSVRIAQILGVRSGANNSGALTFQTNNAGTLGERARIDSSGNLLVGTTSTLGAKFALYGTAGGTNSNIQITNPGNGTGCLGIQGTSSNFKIYNCYSSGTLGTGAGIDIDTSGNVGIGETNPVAALHVSRLAAAAATNALAFTLTRPGTADSLLSYWSDAYSPNGASATLKLGSINATGRSINSTGTNNASGSDYAEYMTKCDDFVVAKGDVVGVNAEGKLTNVFADAVAFLVKSTNPSFVGGDSWGSDFEDNLEELEVARQAVDRIAFSGQVPVNVTGATAGQYIIPVNNNGAIKGQAVSNPTFEQYQIAVGKVIAIEADGRAKIIVKVA